MNIRRKILLILVVAILGLQAASAVEAPLALRDTNLGEQASLPAGGQVQRTVLKNGLVVLTKELHAAPIVTTMVWYKVGSRNEEVGQTGKSHFLEHMLFKGTQKLKKGDIDRLTVKNGGSNNAFTSEDFTAYYFSFASDRWDIALQIEADRMVNNTFAPEEYTPEKQVVIEELQIGLDSPWGALDQEVKAAAYKVHPYHNPVVGWIQDLQRASAQDMQNYYKRFYMPNNATLVIVGDFETEKALARVRELFEALPAAPEPPRVEQLEPPQLGGRRVIVKKATNLERLMMVFHTPKIAEPDSYPLQVLATLLSTGKTSRLYRRLVEKDQSVTEAAAYYGEAKDPTLFQFVVELKPDAKPAEVERAIADEVKQLQESLVPPEELQKAKNLMEADFILNKETSFSQAQQIGASETLLSYTYLDTFLDQIKAVSAEDVRRVAKQYLTEDNATVGWLLNKTEASSAPATGGTGRLAGEPGRVDVATWLRDYGHGRVGRLEPAAHGVGSGGSARSAQPPRRRVRGKPKTTIAEIRPGLPAEKRVLENGLTLIVAENHNIPGVSIAGYVRAGARYETDEKAGVAQLTGRMLTEGTKTRSAQQIAQAIESVGGSLNSSAGYTGASVSATVLKKDFDLALDLVKDTLIHPTFPEDRVKLQRDRLAAEIRAEGDEPQVVGSRQLNEIVFAGTPQHRPAIGYVETVGKLGRDDLVQFHQNSYAPSSTIIAVVGHVPIREAMAKLEAAFGSWSRPPAVLPIPPEPKRPTEPRTKYVFMDKEQTNIFLGHVGISRKNPDYYALEVMDSILGGAPGSGTFTGRIPFHLRDQQGLAYTTYASVTRDASVDPGRFVAYIGCSPKNMAKGIEGLRKEIREIFEKPVNQPELDDAKAYLTGHFVFDFQTNGQIARFLINAEVYGLGFDYVQRYPKMIEAVTVGDISRVARKYLDPENLTLVVIGPVNEKGEIVSAKEKAQ